MVMMLIELPRSAVTAPDWFKMSPPVPVRERPVKAAPVAPVAVGEDATRWRAALDALSNTGKHELDYDDWFKVVSAIHHETGGSAEGFAIAMAWSARSGKHQAEFFETRVWPYLTSDGRQGNTGGTIESLATKHHNWLRPIVPLGAIPDPDRVEAEAALRELQTLAADGGPDGEGVLNPLTGRYEPAVLLEDPAFSREKSGAITATLNNAVLAVRRPDLCGLVVAHDQFRDEITVTPPGVAEWTAMTDADAVRIRMRMERLGFKTAPKEMCRDAVVLVAADNTYDSAQLWLGGLEWDGVPRVEEFLVRYLGCEDTPYARAVALYLWTALAGRVLVPGVKADMVPIFEGDQGLRKSTIIEALSPAPECFVEIDLSEKEDNTVRKLRGALVGEIAELSGLHTRALEDIKKFVVRRVEKWVPKFKEFAWSFHRRLVFVGTTNKTAILADETGNRRWLPIHITSADVEGVVAVRDQLWAEGAVLFRAGGVAWEAAERLAAVAGGAHDTYAVEDSWGDLIASWLAAESGEGVMGPVGDDGQALVPTLREGGALTNGDSLFSISDVLIQAIRLTPGQIDRLAQNRAGAVLRSHGYVSAPVRLGPGGGVVRRWRKERRQ